MCEGCQRHASLQPLLCSTTHQINNIFHVPTMPRSTCVPHACHIRGTHVARMWHACIHRYLGTYVPTRMRGTHVARMWTYHMRAHVKNVFSAIYVLHACYMRAACVHIRGTHAARMWTHVIIRIILCKSIPKHTANTQVCREANNQTIKRGSKQTRKQTSIDRQTGR